MDMRLLPLFIFLTFVGTSLVTAAAPNSQPKKPGPPKDLEQSLADSFVSGSLDVRRQSEYTLQVHFGTVSGDLVDEHKNISPAYVGALVSWNDKPDEAWDLQADATTTQSLILLGISRRNEFLIDYWMPYWKYGVRQTLVGSDMLTNFVDFKKLKAEVAIGFADFLMLEYKLNVEFKVGVGTLGTEFGAQIGWVFPL